MTSLVVIDGQTHSPETAKISVFDRGFLYGDSVFETIRTYQGTPFELDAHLNRLQRSAERVAIQLPVSLTELTQEVREAVMRAGNPESYVRVMVTRGGGPMGLVPPIGPPATRVIFVSPLPSLPEKLYERGVSVITYRTQRVVDATAAQGAKVGNYLVAVLAMREAERVGAHEALIVDGNDQIVEGSTSNVFFVLDDVLATPPEDAGILPGITRARLLSLCRDQGWAVREEPLRLADLPRVQELMVSSSIRELLPVVAVDGEEVGGGKPGPWAQRLLQAYRKYALNSVG